MLATHDEWSAAPDFHVWVDTSVVPPCVGVSGEVDLLTCAPFRDALSEAAELSSGTIVVDLKRVTFMGSTGIREIMRVLRTVERVELRAPSSIVRRALEAATLDHRVVVSE